MTGRRHVAVFTNEADLLAAIEECRARSVGIVDAFSPYPIHGIDDRMGIRRSRLTLVCFFAGLAGLAIGLGFEYWTSAHDWPINVGGKPFDSLPAFVPVGFEMTVLFGGLATALMLFVRSRLWPGKPSRPHIEGVSDDRFALAVAGGDAALTASAIRGILRGHGAVETWEEMLP